MKDFYAKQRYTQQKMCETEDLLWNVKRAQAQRWNRRDQPNRSTIDSHYPKQKKATKKIVNSSVSQTLVSYFRSRYKKSKEHICVNIPKIYLRDFLLYTFLSSSFLLSNKIIINWFLFKDLRIKRSVLNLKKKKVDRKSFIEQIKNGLFFKNWK